MPGGVVIVGSGQAGFQAAASLRSEGFDGPVTIIGEEPRIPYQRPPLSKGFLAGKVELDSIFLRPEQFYRDHRIDLLAGERAVEIDTAAQRVGLASGPRLRYSTLVLAVGARVRKLPVADREFFYLRTLEDSVEIRAALQHVDQLAILGGGFIGLEAAAVASALGIHVTVIEAQPRLMPRVVAPVISDFYREIHQSHGVHFRLGETAIPASARAVIAGIGVLPNVELAAGANLPVADGIIVDPFLRTADPNIYAIGDCANHPNRYAAGRTRIESVQNAVDQARCVAANIAGHNKPYDAVPWFWSDQFDVKLQMAGLSTGYDQVVLRGNPESRRFSAFYFREDRLIAIDSINRPGDHMLGRKLLAAAVQITATQAADESLDLKSLL